MSYRFPDICILQFPFTDTVGIKRRPALLLATDAEGDGIFARITSELYQTPYDVLVHDWEEAGLKLPSVIRVHKLATLGLDMIEEKRGVLSERDTAAFHVVCQKWLEDSMLVKRA